MPSLRLRSKPVADSISQNSANRACFARLCRAFTALLSAAIALYRAMDLTFWLPETEAALAQVEGQ